MYVIHKQRRDNCCGIRKRRSRLYVCMYVCICMYVCMMSAASAVAHCMSSHFAIISRDVRQLFQLYLCVYVCVCVCVCVCDATLYHVFVSHYDITRACLSRTAVAKARRENGGDAQAKQTARSGYGCRKSNKQEGVCLHAFSRVTFVK